MIFAGNPVKLVGVPYVARHAIDTIKDRCKDGDGIEEFLRKMWLLREPVTPYSRGKMAYSERVGFAASAATGETQERARMTFVVDDYPFDIRVRSVRVNRSMYGVLIVGAVILLAVWVIVR